MQGPLVTLGLTCFNAADTIARALTSAFSQDWPNLEFIIVDDNSSDGTRAVVDRLVAEEPRARFIALANNLGPAGARNAVLAAAKGEFVGFIDDDDEALPQRIREQVRCLETYERLSGAHLVACYASGIRTYSNGYRMEMPAIGSRGVVPHGPQVAEYLLLYRRQPEWFYGSGTPSCALLARRTTFQAVGGFDPHLRRVEDVDLAVRLALAGTHFVGTTESLIIQHATSAADKSHAANLHAEIALVMKHKAFLEQLGRYYYALHWPQLRYWHFERRYARFLSELAGLLLRHPFDAARHLLATGPRRLKHERRIR